MTFTSEITFTDAVIDGIAHKMVEGIMCHRIQVSATLLPETAGVLGAQSLVFNPNGTPKEGFKQLELAANSVAFLALFSARQGLIQTLEITGDMTDKYVVERQPEGLLVVNLRLNYHGDPHEALAYWQAVGSAESRLKISPLQTEIPIFEPPADKGARRKESLM